MLIEQYENAHIPIGLPDPIEAIKFQMQQLGENFPIMHLTFPIFRVPYIGQPAPVAVSGDKPKVLYLTLDWSD
jgi:hypothetical protein